MLFNAHLFPSGFFFTPDLFPAFSFDHHDAFSLRLLYVIICQCVFYLCGKYRLMLFRQFPADTDASVAKRLPKRLQRADQSVRCFVDHYCSCLIFQFIQDSLSLLLIRRKKCFKCESSRSKPGYRKRRHTCAGSRNSCNRDPGLLAHLYQFFSRIRDSRHTCIGDHCNIFTILQAFHKFVSFFNLIIFMIAGHRCLNLKMIQKLDTVPGIFCRDQICFFQNPHRPEGHIFQISYRCRT